MRSIKLQAQSYTKAIDFSIIAAEQGHTIAEEALGFAKNIDEAGFSDEERQSYLRGMLDMAYRGERNAQKAHEKFREVRSTLERVSAFCYMNNGDHLLLSSLLEKPEKSTAREIPAQVIRVRFIASFHFPRCLTTSPQMITT